VAIKRWKSKNGRVQYPLPNCKICGKRSNTSDKETAQIAQRVGRICQACTKKTLTKEQTSQVNPKFKQEYEAEFVDTKRKSIWQKIKRLFK